MKSLVTMCLLCLMSMAALPMRTWAQQPPPPVKAGSPTPGILQPEAPNLADRITLTGCVRLTAQAAPGSAAQNMPTDSRFVLNNAVKEARVPAGTGTSPAAAAPAAPTYRLEALESQLSPFIGTQVEISGEVKAVDTAVNANTGAPGRPPVLVVEFVQKIAAACR